MGEEIGRRFTIGNFHFEKATNLTLEEISEGPHFKDDATLICIINNNISSHNHNAQQNKKSS